MNSAGGVPTLGATFLGYLFESWRKRQSLSVHLKNHIFVSILYIELLKNYYIKNTNIYIYITLNYII